VVVAAGPMRGLRRGQQGPGVSQLLGEVQGAASANDALGHHEDGVGRVLFGREKWENPRGSPRNDGFLGCTWDWNLILGVGN